jgi:exosome complex component RRP43
MQPKEEAPSQGQLRINVEIVPFAVSDWRQGSAAEAAGILSARLNTLLHPLNLNQQLCIKEKKAAWQVELDVYVLNADGSVLDAALLSVVSTLMDLELPPIKETQDGGAALLSAADVAQGEVASAASPRKLQLPCLPLALTCCLHKQYLLVDPTHEEEGVATATVTTIVDESGNLHGE